jgi:hypothetical protein
MRRQQEQQHTLSRERRKTDNRLTAGAKNTALQQMVGQAAGWRSDPAAMCAACMEQAYTISGAAKSPSPCMHTATSAASCTVSLTMCVVRRAFAAPAPLVRCALG